MDLYTLDSQFRKDVPVEKYASAIWTERYAAFGDFELKLDANSEMLSALKEGTYLARAGTKEVMLIETQSIEGNELTVSGPTLTGFFRERPVRMDTDHQPRIYTFNTPGVPSSITTTSSSAGAIMNLFVEIICKGSAEGVVIPYNPDFEAFGFYKAQIPNLTIATPPSGPAAPVSVDYDILYDLLVGVAAEHSLGFSMYLDSASESTYSLVFKVTSGRDLTSTQTTNPMVRFSPVLGSLADIKELSSIDGFKNVAYAYAPTYAPTHDAYTPPPGGVAPQIGDPPGVAYADSSAAASTGLQRRVLSVLCDDLTRENVGADQAKLKQILDQRARDALANYSYTRVVDGQVTPQSDYVYGVDYKLGDIVELQGSRGTLQNARITEYIRVKDESGSKEYPTVSVIS